MSEREGADNQRSNKLDAENPVIMPTSLFDDVTKLISDRYGAEWMDDKKQRKQFRASLLSAIEQVGGLHPIPGSDDQSDAEIEIWVEFVVDALDDLDDTAYQVLALVSGDFLFVTREFVEDTVSYQFVTPTPDGGYRGCLNFTGPYVKDFVKLFRLKGREGRVYHA